MLFTQQIIHSLHRVKGTQRHFFASTAKSKAIPKTTSPSEIVEKQSNGYVSYQVKSGDSLYTISKKYPGVSAALIQKANGLPNANIRPGQVLKIPVG